MFIGGWKVYVFDTHHCFALQSGCTDLQFYSWIYTVYFLSQASALQVPSFYLELKIIFLMIYLTLARLKSFHMNLDLFTYSFMNHQCISFVHFWWGYLCVSYRFRSFLFWGKPFHTYLKYFPHCVICLTTLFMLFCCCLKVFIFCVVKNSNIYVRLVSYLPPLLLVLLMILIFSSKSLI